MNHKGNSIITNIIKIKTIIFIFFVSITFSYCLKSYIQNNILIFNKSNEIILFSLFIMIFWIMIVCLYLIYENRTLIKDNTLITLENQKLLYKILEIQEIHYDSIIQSNTITKELIMDGKVNGEI